MTREEFYSLDIHDQVKIANEELSKDHSLTVKKLRDEILHIPKTTWGDRLRKYGYKYDSNERQYISNTNVLYDNVVQEQPKSITNAAEYKDIISYKKPNTNIIQLDNKLKSDLLELVEIKADLLQIVDEYKRNTNVIDIPQLNIEHSKFIGEPKVTTIRVYPNILEQFKDFADSYTEYSKQDIYSMALYEFMNKYKK